MTYNVNITLWSLQWMCLHSTIYYTYAHRPLFNCFLIFWFSSFFRVSIDNARSTHIGTPALNSPSQTTYMIFRFFIKHLCIRLTSLWIVQYNHVHNINERWHHHLDIMFSHHPNRGSSQHWNNVFQLATNKFQL